MSAPDGSGIAQSVSAGEPGRPSLPVTLRVFDRWRASARLAGTHAFVIGAVVAMGYLSVVVVRQHQLGSDLSQAYIPAAHRVVHGQSPYPPATVAALGAGTAYVYPPLTAWLVTPLTLVPVHVAQVIGVVLMIVSLGALLALLEVRDWRCYVVAAVSLPVLSAIVTANLDLPLALGVAALWRYRSHTTVAGVLVGLLFALKLFLWPLAVWLLVTRRYASGWKAGVTAIVLLLAAWAPLGLAGLRGYPHLLQTVTHLERSDGYTLAALIAPVVTWSVATVLQSVAGVVMLALAARNGSKEDERRSYVYTVAALLLFTPIVWLDYFVLLFVVIALRQRTFGWLWLLPLGFWLVPDTGNGTPWQTTATLLLGAAIVAGASRGALTNRWPGDARRAPGPAVPQAPAA